MVAVQYRKRVSDALAAHGGHLKQRGRRRQCRCQRDGGSALDTNTHVWRDGSELLSVTMPGWRLIFVFIMMALLGACVRACVYVYASVLYIRQIRGTKTQNRKSTEVTATVASNAWCGHGSTQAQSTDAEQGELLSDRMCVTKAKGFACYALPYVPWVQVVSVQTTTAAAVTITTTTTTKTYLLSAGSNFSSHQPCAIYKVNDLLPFLYYHYYSDHYI